MPLNLQNRVTAGVRRGQWAPIVVLLAGLWGCEARHDTPAATSQAPAQVLEFSAEELQTIARLTPPEPPPRDETNAVSQDPRAARLGQALFFDTTLSANQAVSCATCHQPGHGFSAPTRLGQGIATTPRHTPSLLNVAYHPWYDWDGRVDSIWAQAFGPLESPQEMDSSRTELVFRVAEDDALRALYEEIFGEMPDLSDAARFPRRARPAAANTTPGSVQNAAGDLTDDPAQVDTQDPATRAWEAMTAADRDTINRTASNLTKAIAAYVEGLVQNDAPFDAFAARLLGRAHTAPGTPVELSIEAQRGLKLFIGKAGCARCHIGPNFSDGSFHNLGLAPRPWQPAQADAPDPGRWRGVLQVQENIFNARGAYSDAPDGERAQWLRYITQTVEDQGQFKTPTLRNVALTPPYMHAGHFETLEDVVRFYSRLDEHNPMGHREDMLLPLGLSDIEISDLVAFLHSLTGAPLPPEALHPPHLSSPQ